MFWLGKTDIYFHIPKKCLKTVRAWTQTNKTKDGVRRSPCMIPAIGDKAVSQADLFGGEAIMRANPIWLLVLNFMTCCWSGSCMISVMRHATNVKLSACEASQGAIQTHNILWFREREVWPSRCCTFCFTGTLSRTEDALYLSCFLSKWNPPHRYMDVKYVGQYVHRGLDNGPRLETMIIGKQSASELLEWKTAFK